MAVDTRSHYELLNIPMTATEAEIRKAYRQTSRTVHPDRNPAPDAALLFHALTEAAELLTDPQKRTAYDLQLKAAQAKQLRFAALDSKRKAQTADLEEREEAFKRQRGDDLLQERQRKLEMERLKAEGARMRKDRETAIHANVNASRAQAQSQSGNDATSLTNGNASIETLEPLDTTLRLKWPLTLNLNTEPLLRSYLNDALPVLEKRDAIDSIVISAKKDKANGTMPRKMAIVVMKTLSAAIDLALAASKNVLLQEFNVTWVKGEPPVAARKALGLDTAQTQVSDVNENRAEPPPPTSPRKTYALDEDSVLAQMRARQAERERLEREILEKEALEE